MAANRTVRTRCRKCGHVGRTKARQLRCYQTRIKGGYACWGELEPVVPARPAEVDIFEAVMDGALARAQAADRRPAKRPQDVAAAKLAEARRKVSEVTRKIARATTSLRLWERRAAYYAQRASMTDAELAAERDRRLRQEEARRNRTRVRAIAVGGKL